MRQAGKFPPEKRAKMGRRPKGSPNWRLRFLEVLAVHGNVREAAQAAGISRRMTFKERALNDAFAAAWGLAKAEAADRMEAAAYRRAVEGVVRQRKVGDQIVEYREYSDTLLMFLLKEAGAGPIRRNHFRGPAARLFDRQLAFEPINQPLMPTAATAHRSFPRLVSKM